MTNIFEIVACYVKGYPNCEDKKQFQVLQEASFFFDVFFSLLPYDVTDLISRD